MIIDPENLQVLNPVQAMVGPITPNLWGVKIEMLTQSVSCVSSWSVTPRRTARISSSSSKRFR